MADRVSARYDDPRRRPKAPQRAALKAETGNG
jgi:hypothetical protein